MQVLALDDAPGGGVGTGGECLVAVKDMRGAVASGRAPAVELKKGHLQEPERFQARENGNHGNDGSYGREEEVTNPLRKRCQSGAWALYSFLAAVTRPAAITGARSAG